MISVTSSRARVLLLCAPLVSGCASLPDTHTTQVGDAHIEYVQAGNGMPVVVFESGLDGTLDWWVKVFPEVAKASTAFAYNRPGYGRSTIALTTRDGEHVIEELRALLKARKLTPPYVLVGHSLGGLYMQLYARHHPDEVAALVLVDSTHPEQLKGAGARENWPLLTRAAFGLLTSDTAKAELEGIEATGMAVQALPPVSGKPVIILSAMKPMTKKSALADDANAKRRDIAHLYPGAQVRWVDSGHGIPLDNPKAVVTAIQDAVLQVRAIPSR